MRQNGPKSPHGHPTVTPRSPCGQSLLRASSVALWHCGAVALFGGPEGAPKAKETHAPECAQKSYTLHIPFSLCCRRGGRAAPPTALIPLHSTCTPALAPARLALRAAVPSKPRCCAQQRHPPLPYSCCCCSSTCSTLAERGAPKGPPQCETPARKYPRRFLGCELPLPRAQPRGKLRVPTTTSNPHHATCTPAPAPARLAVRAAVPSKSVDSLHFAPPPPAGMGGGH